MILIKNARFILGEKTLENKNIIIDKDKIMHIGDQKDKTDIIIDAKDCIVSPGLVNTHTHAAMTLFRGFSEDLPLHDWLNKVWAVEAKLTKDDIFWGTLLACTEMIKSGTTSFIDMYFNVEEVAKATEKAGMRALLTETLFDFFDDDKMKDKIKSALRASRLAKKYEGSKIQIGISPHAPYTCSQNLLHEAKYLADKNKLKMQIHASETRKEIEDVASKHKAKPIELLNSIGLLNKNVMLAHCVWPFPDEITLMANKNIFISHCPISNMKLASGIAPVEKMHKYGINITLGTDGPSSNNTLNMFETLKAAALLQKVVNADPTFPDARTIFNWATVNGGKFLGIDNTLKEGSIADLILIDMKKPNLVPIYDPISHFVYSMNGSEVRTSIIGGKIVMKDYKLTNVKEDILYAKIKQIKETFIPQ